MLHLSHLSQAARRRGTVVVATAVSALAIFGIVAIVIDGGLLQDRRRQVQAATDASALAAAKDLFETYTDTDPYNNGLDANDLAREHAFAIAAANGHTNDGISSFVTVNIPPASGPYKDEPGHVEVIIESQEQRHFSTIFGSEPVPIRARAVARGKFDPKAIGILVLDPYAEGALTVSGEATGIVSNAAVVVNSNHAWAGYGEGTSASLTADVFQFHGGVNSTGVDQFNGPIFYGYPRVPDPYRDLPQPDPATLPVRSVADAKVVDHGSGYKTYYLEPGRYPGGLFFDGKSSVEMAPGIYYMEGNSTGGGFKFRGNEATSLTATNVMLFNDRGTNTETNRDSSAYPSIDITGQATVSWSPPSEGIYKNFSFFQARNQDMTLYIAGGGGFDISGVFYTPDALLDVAGSGDSVIGSQYISRLVTMRGTGTYRVDWDPGKIPPVRHWKLVE